MSKVLNIALVGSPNSGKTTLYNWLTGANNKTVNYPGATVDFSKGELRKELALQLTEKYFDSYLIYDTPGVYSLSAKSADEDVTVKILSEQKLFKIDLALVVLDATQLNRQLLICEQLRRMNIPYEIVLTMNDVANIEGLKISDNELKKYFSKNQILHFDGLLGRGLLEIVQVMNSFKPADYKIKTVDWVLADIQKMTTDLHIQYKKTVTFSDKINDKSHLKLTLKMDQFLLHPIFGTLTFLVLMTLLFSSIYWVAQPFMDFIQFAFDFFAEFVKNNVPGLIGEFISGGIIASISGVIIFIPQIFILFLFIGLLENSGYLARIAALVDRPLSLIGLGGRSFVPMLSGFACAVPAIMATRNIKSKKEKLVAQFVIPFMTCSARLPVYALILGFLFAGKNPIYAGFGMAILYLLSIVVGAIASSIVASFIDHREKSQLSLDLPLYRKPRFKVLFLQAIAKSKSFLFRAGPIIFILALFLWFGSQFPRSQATENLSPSQITEQSYAAQFGRAVQPVFEPLGVDWRVGFGLISAFAAREVFVSALAIVFHVEGNDDEKEIGLIAKMQNAKFESGKYLGKPIFTVASCIGILIFFMIALQCLSTFAILKKESGMLMAIMQLVSSNVVAYALAVTAVSIIQGMGY